MAAGSDEQERPLRVHTTAHWYSVQGVAVFMGMGDAGVSGCGVTPCSMKCLRRWASVRRDGITDSDRASTSWEQHAEPVKKRKSSVAVALCIDLF